MTKVIGTIESLKSLKRELNNKGVTRFKSVKEINDFLSNYNIEKTNILQKTTIDLEKRFEETTIELEQKIQNKEIILKLKTEKINNDILEFNKSIELIESCKNKNFFKKIINYFKLFILKRKLNYILNNKTYFINSSVKSLIPLIEKDKLFIQEYNKNKQLLISRNSKPKTAKLEYFKKVIEKSNKLIAGAIGENLVVKELTKLSNEFTLINDFKLNFDPPIIYKNNRDKISSIQIDHLLISKAGIFILETKNWSEQSINSVQMNSPIKQIFRFNYAMKYFTNKNIKIIHNWGFKKIPIRNVIVMINNKPLGEFESVKITLITELNNYVNSFEPVFTDRELRKIVSRLVKTLDENE